MGTTISFIPQNSGGGTGSVTTLFNLSTFTSITSTTSNTLTGSVLIPANTLNTSTQYVAELTARALKNGTAGITTLRVYINTTSSLSGATLLATGGTSTSADIFQQVSRVLLIPSYTGIVDPTAAIYSDDSRFTITETKVNSIDWTIDQYVILAVQNASTADSTIGSAIVFKIFS